MATKPGSVWNLSAAERLALRLVGFSVDQSDLTDAEGEIIYRLVGWGYAKRHADDWTKVCATKAGADALRALATR